MLLNQHYRVYSKLFIYYVCRTKASISLAWVFLATVLRIYLRTFRITFVRVWHECRENLNVSRTNRDLVAKALYMFKSFMRFVSPKYVARLSCDNRTTFVRVSQNFGESCIYIINLCREIVVNKSRTNL